MESSSKERFSCLGRKSLSVASSLFFSSLGVFAVVLLLEAFLVSPCIGAAMHWTKRNRSLGEHREGVRQGSRGPQSCGLKLCRIRAEPAYQKCVDLS